MAAHVSHTGVHDHGFNNLSTYGNFGGGRFTENEQKRNGALAQMGAMDFAYDMVGYGNNQVDHKMPIALLLQTWNSKNY